MSEADIRAVIETRRRALHDRDAAAFLATYAPGAEIYDLAPPLAHGLDPDGVAAWLASWDGPVGNETAGVTLTLSGPFAVAHGLERLTGSQGGEPRDIWLRFTLVLERLPEGWRIVHEHTSVPFRKGRQLLAATDLTPDGRDP
jgi:ketosteroid isomerase-like protein